MIENIHIRKSSGHCINIEQGAGIRYFGFTSAYFEFFRKNSTTVEKTCCNSGMGWLLFTSYGECDYKMIVYSHNIRTCVPLLKGDKTTFNIHSVIISVTL